MNRRAPTTGTIVGVGGSRLRTLAWKPEAEVVGRVLVVHGFTEHAGRYDGLARHLTARGLAVFAFDLRGHGASEGSRGHLESFELLVEDVHLAGQAAARRLPGAGPPLLYGHSLGGLVVLRYLQTHRPTAPGVVLSAPWLGTAAKVPGWKRVVARLLRRWAPEVTLSSRSVHPENLTRDPEIRRAFLDDPLVHRRISPHLFFEVEEAQARALEQGAYTSVPILVLVPGDDRVVDSALTLRWAESVEGRSPTVIRLEGFRHEPHNDTGREVVLETLGSWMLERARAGPGAGEA